MIRARAAASHRSAGVVGGDPFMIGIADRAMQAAAGLAIMGAFLAAAGPEEFGRYILALSLALLPLGMHAAAVTAPMRTLLPRQTPPAREALAGGFRRLSRLLGMAAALAVAAAVLAVTGGDAALAVAGAALAFALVLRERSRAEWHAHLLGPRSLRQTAFQAAAALATIALLVGAGALHARSALLALAAASLAAAVLFGRTAMAGPAASLRATWLRARPLASRRMLGAVAMWAQSNLYVIATCLALDLGALGRVAMARAVLLPVTLAVAALGVALRPRLAVLVAAGDGDGLLAARRRALAAALAGVAVYGLVMDMLIAGFGERLVAGAYAGTDGLARLWLVDGLLVAGAGAVAPFLIGTGQLRALALAYALSGGIGLAAIVSLAPAYGAAGVLAAQLAADAVLCAALLSTSDRVLRTAAPPVPLAKHS